MDWHVEWYEHSVTLTLAKGQTTIGCRKWLNSELPGSLCYYALCDLKNSDKMQWSLQNTSKLFP